jgi:hypothetical protein
LGAWMNLDCVQRWRRPIGTRRAGRGNARATLETGDWRLECKTSAGSYSAQVADLNHREGTGARTAIVVRVGPSSSRKSLATRLESNMETVARQRGCR